MNHTGHIQNYILLLIKNRLTFRQRWKLLAFIEKLSGRPIGFYCYDLFPMNNYEFYKCLEQRKYCKYNLHDQLFDKNRETKIFEHLCYQEDFLLFEDSNSKKKE